MYDVNIIPNSIPIHITHINPEAEPHRSREGPRPSQILLVFFKIIYPFF